MDRSSRRNRDMPGVCSIKGCGEKPVLAVLEKDGGMTRFCRNHVKESFERVREINPPQ